MPFSMTFRPPADSGFTSDAVHFEAAKSLYALTIETCEQLDEAGAEFVVTGFGLEWPTDVGYDLGSILSDIPLAMVFISQGREAELYFYGQGLERKLYFQPVGENTKIRVELLNAADDQPPDPEVESLPTDELVEVLGRLCVAVATAIVPVNPELSEVQPFPQWRQGVIALS